MDFATLFRTKENLNLDKNTLTILRYIAIFGQFIAVNIVFFYLKLEFPIIESYLIIFFGLLTNVYLQFIIKVKQLKDTYASFFLLYDLMQLSILLYLTGGILNPFCILLIIPIGGADMPVVIPSFASIALLYCATKFKDWWFSINLTIESLCNVESSTTAQLSIVFSILWGFMSSKISLLSMKCNFI